MKENIHRLSGAGADSANQISLLRSPAVAGSTIRPRLGWESPSLSNRDLAAGRWQRRMIGRSDKQLGLVIQLRSTRLVFWVSTALFCLNVIYQSLLWIINMDDPPNLAKNLFHLMHIPILNTIAWFGGFIAGVFGLLFLSITGLYWLLNPTSRRRIKEATEWRYVFLPVLYGVVWIAHLTIGLVIEPQM